MTTRAAITAVTELTTASEPHESHQRHGRPGDGAAAARTQDLYAQFGRTVSGLCGALLRSRTDAEDAAQQTFLSAHRALLNGSRPEQPAAWLATIARNECWSRIRTRMREPLPAEAVEAASAEPDPLAEAIRNADLAALWLAIETCVETAAPGAGAVVEPAAGGESCASRRPTRFGIAIRLWLLERTRVVPTRLTTTPRIRAWLARPMTVAPLRVSARREPSAARA